MGSLKIFGRINIPDQVLNVVVFLVLFFIGIMGGRSIGMITFSNGVAQKDIVGDSSSKVNNGQQNLLIITVDQLAAAKPVLESIWLLIISPEISDLTLVPVYPKTPEGSKTLDLSLAQAFAMTAQKNPHSEFLELLREKVYWHNYLIVDQKSMSNVIRILHKFAGGFPGEEKQMTSILLPQTGQEVDRNLESQVRMWNEICFELSRISKTGHMEELFQQISPYIHTNLVWEELSQQWSYEQPSEFLIGCEFPTLILNSP